MNTKEILTITEETKKLLNRLNDISVEKRPLVISLTMAYMDGAVMGMNIKQEVSKKSEIAAG